MTLNFYSMKLIYLAHPIGGNVSGNIMRLSRIIRYINLKHHDIIPFAPYISDLLAMNDGDESERSRGFMNNRHYFDHKIIDALWICGNITSGVAAEMNWALQNKIPVINMADVFDQIIEINETRPDYHINGTDGIEFKVCGRCSRILDVELENKKQ